MLLNSLSVFPEAFDGTEYRGMSLRDGPNDARLKVRIAVDDAERDSWQARYWLAHHIDLHAALKRRAAEVGVLLRTGCPVERVDCETASVWLAGDEVKAADVIVAADGVHSVAREAVVGERFATKSSGKCCYRWLMPYEALAGDEELKMFAEEAGVLTELSGGDRRIVFYPCSGGTLMNCAAFVPVGEVGGIQPGTYGQQQEMSGAC